MTGLDYLQIGGRVRKLREQRLMTQEQLAEQLDVSIKFVRDIETGAKGMSLKTLDRLSKCLLVSTDSILYGGDAEPCSAEIMYLMRICPPEKQRFAADLLRAFVKSHNGEP